MKRNTFWVLGENGRRTQPTHGRDRPGQCLLTWESEGTGGKPVRGWCGAGVVEMVGNSMFKDRETRENAVHSVLLKCKIIVKHE